MFSILVYGLSKLKIPFEALYIWVQVPYHGPCPYEKISNAAVNELLGEMKIIETHLKEDLQKAQNRLKHYAGKKRTEKSLDVGD